MTTIATTDVGRRVVYRRHDIEERGIITRVTSHFVFVMYDGTASNTPKATLHQDLIFEQDRQP